MNAKNSKKVRPGVALLVVLFIVMAITILSLGFVSRSDVELACGQNMLMKTQIDYLAESGLEHAKGLILNPQDVDSSVYWEGGTSLQLTSGSDFYEVKVERDTSDLCNYIIDCSSYRLEGPERTGLSRLQAVLRIDPCIAYWVGSNTTVSPQMTINGDVYCDDNLINDGTINGDVFATGTISGTNIEGQKITVTEAPVAWPNLISTDFGLTYYIGSTPYSAEEVVDANHPTGGPFNPTGTNPAGIRYSNSNVNIPGDVNINGTLVVNGTLRISGLNNVITAEKNFPALLVTEQVIMEDGASLVIQGLAQIQGPITFDPNVIYASLQVKGGLFINNGGIEGITSGSVVVSADPAIASIETWPGSAPNRWRPMAGAFYRSIERK
ncbi:MAG: hypothetical protein ACFFCW_26210 [Candidatus Hodarchaeota archaeon]